MKNRKRKMNFLLKLPALICLCGCLISLPVFVAAQNGKDARWESAGKQGIGTAFNLQSKIWFTLQGGSLTEVFYPTADKANVQLLQFVVVNPQKKIVETERDEANHEIKILRADSLSFQQINTAKSGDWKITKTYATDVERASLLIDVRFETKSPNLFLYVYYDPSLNNSGMGDTAWTQDDALLASDGDTVSALVVNPSINRTWTDKINKSNFCAGCSTNGFFGVNDGLTELRKTADGNWNTVERVENGNVVQTAFIGSGKFSSEFSRSVLRVSQEPIKHFTLSLGFGKTTEEALQSARSSLRKGFVKCLSEYEKEWSGYVRTIPKVEQKYQTQFNYAAMVLKASEDKTFRGGNVASLSKPWITGTAANDAFVGGYHLVWSRDLYQVATAYIALGDTDSASRALDYLFKVQQRKDGSYPQISWLDGRTLGDWIQMDEVSYPLILAYQLGKTDRETYLKHIKPTADYIFKNGPYSQQERWEEKPGYSPATIAAEIAGLVCAADIAQKNGDEKSAKMWLEKADDWAKNVEKWTATKTGKFGDGNYYLRLTKNGTPDAGERIELNNNAGTFQENEIVDAGFLELVRLGIKSPNDALIVKSLKVVDEVLRVNTPNGEAFYRYNHDGYGEMADGRPWNWDLKYTGKGHLWALLSGERGQYELALAEKWWADWNRADAEKRKLNPDLAKAKVKRKWLDESRSRLDAMLNFANDGLMIPEQVWDKPETNKNLKFGEGAGSATPLAWSMAQFIRLAINLQKGKNMDTPEVVARRYGNLN